MVFYFVEQLRSTIANATSPSQITSKIEPAMRFVPHDFLIQYGRFHFPTGEFWQSVDRHDVIQGIPKHSKCYGQANICTRTFNPQNISTIPMTTIKPMAIKP